MELKFGEDQNGNERDGRRKRESVDWNQSRSRDLFKDLYGDLYGQSDRTGEGGSEPEESEQGSPAGSDAGKQIHSEKRKDPAETINSAEETNGAKECTESELEALARAQRALMEAAEKFGRANDVPMPENINLQESKGTKNPQQKEKEASEENQQEKKTEKRAEEVPGENSKKNSEQENLKKRENQEQAAEKSTEQEGAKEEAPKEPEKDPMDELNELIGLSGIKHDVRELYDFTKIQKLREEAGMKTVPVSKHLVFTGNPGTGKTTVARILARLYQKIGVLSKGQLVECDRSGLVAGYVGQTAVKTQKKIEEAMGGVLFIDEAYSLARGADQGSDFGQEAIDTLLKAMEDHRDDFIVIVAGYTKPMETFIQSNPGLKSRFNKFIEFPDYTVEELLQIFDLNCRKYQYVPDPEARDQVKTLLMLQKAKEPENFANARAVRNLFETIITNQARRVAGMENPTKEDMQRIQLEDLRDDEDGNVAAGQKMTDTTQYPEETETLDTECKAETPDTEHGTETLDVEHRADTSEPGEGSSGKEEIQEHNE